MKSDKHDSATKGVQISIPQKDAIAIEPPKKVRIAVPLGFIPRRLKGRSKRPHVNFEANGLQH